jgi:hypothetical protein
VIGSCNSSRGIPKISASGLLRKLAPIFIVLSKKVAKLQKKEKKCIEEIGRAIEKTGAIVDLPVSVPDVLNVEEHIEPHKERANGFRANQMFESHSTRVEQI